MALSLQELQEVLDCQTMQYQSQAGFLDYTFHLLPYNSHRNLLVVVKAEYLHICIINSIAWLPFLLQGRMYISNSLLVVGPSSSLHFIHQAFDQLFCYFYFPPLIQPGFLDLVLQLLAQHCLDPHLVSYLYVPIILSILRYYFIPHLDGLAPLRILHNQFPPHLLLLPNQYLHPHGPKSLFHSIAQH